MRARIRVVRSIVVEKIVDVDEPLSVDEPSDVVEAYFASDEESYDAEDAIAVIDWSTVQVENLPDEPVTLPAVAAPAAAADPMW